MVPEVKGDRAGLVGFGCLCALALGGGLGGGALLVVGTGRVVAGAQGTLRDAGDAHALAGSLEGAVALCGAGALLLLVAIVATLVLFKELGDDAARRARGPVVGDGSGPRE